MSTPVTSTVRNVSVDMGRLDRVGARPGFFEYLVQIWDYRQFIFFDARARVLTGTRRDRLGSAWLLLNPVFNGLTYFVVFGMLLQTSKGIPNFVGYLIIGIFLFQFSSGSIVAGARSISNNKAIIQAFNFPRAILPIGTNLRECMTAVPLVLAMLLLIIVFPPAEAIGLKWFLLLPAIGLQAMFNLGVSLILARLIARVNDVNHLLPFLMRAWMYSSAIFYSFDRFISHPVLLSVMKANPLFNVIDIVRSVLLYNHLPSWQSWATLAIWAFGSVVVGLVFFWQAEEKYVHG